VSLRPGDPAPEFTLPDTAGRLYARVGAPGRPLVLVFLRHSY
jgi:peroxiredoxin